MDKEQNTIRYVSQNIRSLRIKSGLSLKVAANRLGISSSSLSKIESGAIDVNLSRLQKIAELYKIDLVQLWTLHFDNAEAHELMINTAKKRVYDLELEITAFQKKIIFLYEKLMEQSA